MKRVEHQSIEVIVYYLHLNLDPTTGTHSLIEILWVKIDPYIGKMAENSGHSAHNQNLFIIKGRLG